MARDLCVIPACVNKALFDATMERPGMLFKARLCQAHLKEMMVKLAPHEVDAPYLQAITREEMEAALGSAP